MAFPRSKRETRSEYITRLRRAAQGLSAKFVRSAIGDQLLYQRRGALFEEGGSRSHAAG